HPPASYGVGGAASSIAFALSDFLTDSTGSEPPSQCFVVRSDLIEQRLRRAHLTWDCTNSTNGRITISNRPRCATPEEAWTIRVGYRVRRRFVSLQPHRAGPRPAAPGTA